jgi:primosomal protein N' (replication factor Y)
MLLEVALPLPLLRTFTYRAEQELAEGTRVRVPFAGRKLVGWVAGVAQDSTAAEKAKPIERVLDTTPAVPPELFRLCQWTAEYYIAPLGLVLRAALPAALSDSTRRDTPERKRRVVRITRELPSLQQRDELFQRAARQRELYDVLESMGGTADVAHLTQQLGFSAAIVRGLVERGVARIHDERVDRDPFRGMDIIAPEQLTLTEAQTRSLETLLHAVRIGPDKPFLLRGVTGSGKTLVYIELLKEVVGRQGRGAIVLVPEIALTPQTVARFRSHFGDDVAVLHSALSDGERYDAWRALRAGERRIAVGARSAIFAPVANLGAIVVDEEHEATYKQGETPRYHARELAIMRAHLAGAICLLGSATPSLESWHNALVGKFELLELPVRVEGRPLPPVYIIDLRTSARSDADAARGRRGDAATTAGEITGSQAQPIAASPCPRVAASILSAPLIEGIQKRLARKEQTILLLNRRGYSTFVQCRECGHVWQCQQCNVSLTFHRARRRVVCHYCFREEPAPVVCPECQSGDIAYRGIGTEQVERTVAETFPSARIARMDVDTTSAKWSHHDILARFEKGDVDILLGTQMIAKGLDFPRVTLVGVVNADVGMNLPDFRAGERTFQLLTQVAGRAGRGPTGGEVFVQTSLPNHYAIRAAIEHDYASFAERELQERRQPLYPPLCRLANIVISGLDEEAVRLAAEVAARFVADAAMGPELELIGPAPCPIDRVRGRWRWHFILRSTSSGLIARACRNLLVRHGIKPGKAELRLILDRDPVSLM